MTGRRQKKTAVGVVDGDGGPAAAAAAAHEAPPVEPKGNNALVTIAILLAGLITRVWVSQVHSRTTRGIPGRTGLGILLL